MTYITLYTIVICIIAQYPLGNTYFSNIKCITILQNRCIRSIYYLHNRTNIDHIYIHKRILKCNDIIDVTMYMYKAWYHYLLIKTTNPLKKFLNV